VVLALLVVALISFVAASHDVAPSQVGVDWGSIKSPACPPGQANCNDVAVDWGSIKSAPVCPRDNPNCGELAVNQGNNLVPTYSVDKSNDDTRQEATQPLTCPSKGRGCVKTNVDWGS
jgi:hypothetical protein